VKVGAARSKSPRADHGRGQSAIEIERQKPTEQPYCHRNPAALTLVSCVAAPNGDLSRPRPTLPCSGMPLCRGPGSRSLEIR